MRGVNQLQITCSASTGGARLDNAIVMLPRVAEPRLQHELLTKHHKSAWGACSISGTSFSAPLGAKLPKRTSATNDFSSKSILRSM